MAKRRSRGDGSVYQHHNGMYYYQYIDATGRKHVKTLRTRNRAEAEKKAKAFSNATTAEDTADVLHQAAKARALITHRDLPLSDVWTAFRATEPTGSPGTLRNYERALRDFTIWLSDKYPAVQNLNAVTNPLATEYCHAMSRTGMSNNTYNYRRNALGLITEALAETYGIQDNPWHRKSLRRKEQKQSRKPLSCQQALDLIELLDNPDNGLPYIDEARPLVKMLLYTGARLTDAVNMTWDCVSLTRRRIEYTPAKTASKGKVAEVPIVPTLYNELAMLDANRAPDQAHVFAKLSELYARNPDGIQKPLVALIQTITGDGRGANGKGGQRLVNRAAYGAHSLRTTFASQAALAGCKSVWLARMLGDSIATVDKYYIQAGVGDRILPSFNDLPGLLTDNTPTPALSDGEPERNALHKLIDTMPIEQIREQLAAMCLESNANGR